MGEIRLDHVLERLAVTLRGRGDDEELLGRFVAQRDESAFAALLARHGPMVLGVCRRVLRNEADAEDAFQATFLVLARKAASIRPRGQIGNWLYGVAHRTALEARRLAAVRRAKEARAVPKCMQADEGRSDLLGTLDGELARLPRGQREVIVLCDLEGRGRKEVAGLLGCPEGTVASRLARARRSLARRLARHGLALPAGAVLAVGGDAVPAALAGATVKGAASFAAGEAAGAVPARVVRLAEGVMRVMFANRLTKAALLLLVVLLAAGAGLASVGKAPPPSGPIAKQAAPKEAPAKKSDEEKKAATDLEKLGGTWYAADGGSAVWVIRGGKLTEYRQPEYPGTREEITLDTAKRPRTINVSGERKGTYEIEGDTLKVWLMPSKGPMGGMPAPGGMGGEFKKEHATLTVFKRSRAKEKLVLSGEIGNTYRDNDALADETFADRRVTVLATVKHVRRAGEGYHLLNEAGTKVPLLFAFDKEARGQLAKLKPGQVVTVQGRCQGRTKKEGGEVIAFADCKLVPAKD